MALLGACSATKFVPEGEYMLESVSVKSTDKSLDATSLNLNVISLIYVL